MDEKFREEELLSVQDLQKEIHPSIWKRMARAEKSGAEWLKKEIPLTKDRAVALFHKEQELQAKVIAGTKSAIQKEQELVKQYKKFRKEHDKEIKSFQKKLDRLV